MRTQLELEDFGSVRRSGAGPDRRARELIDAARAEGVEEGRNAALSEIDANQQALIANAHERLRDIELSAASARAEAEGRLRPVIDALIRAVAPVAARKGLADAIADAVAARLAAAPGAPVMLRCAPEEQAALAEKFGDELRLAPDPELGAGGARLEWRGGGVDYDADACAADALRALNAFFGDAEDDLEEVIQEDDACQTATS